MNDIEKLKAALLFYADPANYIDTPPWDGDPTCITEKAIPVTMQEGSQVCDCGDVARAALLALGERDVGIKPLEWRKNYESEFLSFAETVVGRYRVWSHHEADGKWFWRRNDDAGGIVASEQDAKSAAQADFNQRIRSALVPSSERDALRDRVAELEWAATHRHKKRGSTYTLIGVGKMQAEHWIDQRWHRDPNSDEPPKSTWSLVDMREVAIYRSVDDGSLWVRPKEEFEDGRFEALSHGDQP